MAIGGASAAFGERLRSSSQISRGPSSPPRPTPYYHLNPEQMRLQAATSSEIVLVFSDRPGQSPSRA